MPHGELQYESACSFAYGALHLAQRATSTIPQITDISNVTDVANIIPGPSSEPLG